MDLWDVYWLFSVSVFSTAVLKAWRQTQSLYLFSTIFFQGTYGIVAFNLAFSSLFAIGNLFLSFFLGKITSAESNQFEKLMGIGMNLVFDLMYYRFDNIKAVDLTLLPLLLPLFRIQFIIADRIDRFSLMVEQPAIKTHKRIMAGQIIFSTVILSIIPYLLGDPSHLIRNLLAKECILLFVDSVRTIIRHFIYLSDRANNGNSSISTDRIYYTDFIFNLIAAIFSLVFSVLIAAPQITLFSLIALFPTQVAKIFRLIIEFCKHQVLIRTIDPNLPSPTEEELAEDNTCIVCRLPMTPDDSKKLPCGHIIHKQCLEQWVSKKDTCPICKADLMSITKSNETHENEDESSNSEEQPENPSATVSNADDLIFGNRNIKDISMVELEDLYAALLDADRKINHTLDQLEEEIQRRNAEASE